MNQTSDNSVIPIRAVGVVAGIALCIFATIEPAAAQPPHSPGSVMPTGSAGYPPAPGMMAPGMMPPASSAPGMMHHPFPYSQPMYPQPPGAQFSSHGMRHSAVKTGEEWEPGALEKALTAMTQGAWIRIEYLLWEIDEPGNELLGAPVAGVRNPGGYFPVVDPSTQTTIGMARVPTLSDISMRDNNGIRGTFGIPTVAGDLEGTIWTLDQARETFSAIDLPSVRQNLNDPNSPLPTFVGTSTLVNGELGTNIELYDESFTVDYMSKVWGAEAKFVFDTSYPDDWFTLKPMIGFHHLNIQEELRQIGVFSGRTSDQPLLQPLVSEIDSETTNHLYGALLGARLEFVHPWITLGLEPKVTLGADRYKARVRTNNFRGLQDGEVITEMSDTIFSPVVELAVYLRFKVHERAEFHVGYNVLWASRVTRPHDNIRYNDNGSFPEPPGVVVDVKHDDFTLEGLTLGGVIYLH